MVRTQSFDCRDLDSVSGQGTEILEAKKHSAIDDRKAL